MVEVQITEPFERWLQSLKDRKVRQRIADGVTRLAPALVGDWKGTSETGVLESRVDYGPGYRIYYAQRGMTVVILLWGGDKRTQTADIRKAKRLQEIENG